MLKEMKLLFRIMKNRFAMKNFCEPFLYKLDIAVTYRCNLRCKYCRIWRVKKPDSMTLRNYESLFNNLNLSWLHLTGGEPFLRRDFNDIVILASESMDSLLIVDTSTNGFMTEKIVEDCKKILDKINCKFEIGVSIDGVEHIHNKLRGMGSWRRSLDTYKRLKTLESDYDNFGVHVNHVINPRNVEVFDDFLKEMEKNGININDISVEVARNSPFFNNEDIKINFGDDLIKTLIKITALYEQKKNKNFRERLRFRYLKEMVKFTTNKRTVVCASGYASCFIDPNGFLYGCSMMKQPIGNIREKNIHELFESNEMKTWRRNYKNCNMCWSGCEGITSLIQNSFL